MDDDWTLNGLGQKYIDVIEGIISHNDFTNFRRNKDYVRILEHCSETEAEFYLEILNQINIDSDLLIKFKENDNIGSPAIRNRLKYGNISNATLKYMKIAYDIASMNIGNDITILEIGGGYGGQIKILNDLIGIEKAYLADIPLVEELQQRYLENFNIVTKKINTSGISNSNDVKFDLTISNHALCELPTNIQELYLPLINNSKHGYIMYDQTNINNKIAHYGGYILEDILKKINHTCAVHYNSYGNLPTITW